MTLDRSGAIRYYYGAMGCGKSTLALQVHHNLSAVGVQTRLLTPPSRSADEVVSRIGMAYPAKLLEASVDVVNWLITPEPIECLILDEAHLLPERQVDDLVRWADDNRRDVLAFGLLTDFRGQLFEASKRWIELADELVPIRTELRCSCGRPATHNARMIDGLRVFEGPAVLVGGLVTDIDPQDNEGERVEYVSLCRHHWRCGFDV